MSRLPPQAAGQTGVAARPMTLKHMTISGYRGISDTPGQELHLTDLACRNVFIGQNNGGKSTAFRFLLQVVNRVAIMGNSFPDLQPQLTPIDPNMFWQQNVEAEPLGVLTFSSPGPDFGRVEQPGVGGAIVRDNEWRLSIRIRSTGGSQATFFISPQVRVDSKNEWMDVFRIGGQQWGEMEYLASTGEYTRHDLREKSSFVVGAHEFAPLVKEWAHSGRFFDPFRSLHRSDRQNQQRVEDGSGLLQRLFDWQNNNVRSASFHRFKKRLLTRLNRLFDSRYADVMLRGAPSMDMSLTLEAPDAIPIPLQSMGSGIAQMVILLASLEADTAEPGASYHYHLEEPELHLHPRLLRRFMAQLTDFPNVQFFISSHSNVILDTLQEGDRVYWFSQEPAGNCLARQVEGIIDQHGLLDALGVSGASLLQTNCVIWVEGPSDRLYLRRWLNDLARETGVELLEGADYTFVFYGGKVLSHFGFEAEDCGLEDLVPMLAISRYSAVVMDRDQLPLQPEQPLSDAKKKIVEAAGLDPNHRQAYVSEGREIENDLPLAAFKAGVVRKLAIESASLDTLVLQGQSRYPDEVVAHLSLTGDLAEKALRKLRHKVGLAAEVLASLDEQGKPLTPRPAYVDALFKFIEKSRVE
jgi:predicted ATPase